MGDAQEFLAESGFEPNELPGLGALIALWLIVFQAIRWLLSQGMPNLVQAILASDSLLLILAASFSIFTYNLGSLWDDIFFDPNYQASDPSKNQEPGKLLQRKWSLLFLLFPNGKDLVTSREKFAEAFSKAGGQGVGPHGYGAYKPAKQILTRNRKWGKVRGRLNWSKVFRSLILPFLLITTFYGSLIALSPFFNRTSISMISFFTAIIAFLISAGFYICILWLVKWYMIDNEETEEDKKEEKRKKGQKACIILPILFLVATLLGFLVSRSDFPAWISSTGIVLIIILGSIVLSMACLSVSIRLRVSHMIEMYNLAANKLPLSNKAPQA